MAINIVQCNSTANTTACSRTPKYIVIHYTAGTKSVAGTALSTAKYFAKTTTKASADFIVDDSTIVQFNADPKKRYTWAVGGSKYASMSTSQGGKYYGVCTNSNSISIEMCSNKTNTASLKATDTDWYITEATLSKTVELTKHLMALYNIPVSNVIMHHHVTGKQCPNPFCVNEAALSKWNAFKARLTATTSTTTTSTSGTSVNYIVKVIVDELNIRNNPGTTGTKVVGVCSKNVKYTIVEEQKVGTTVWGKLKSGAGWISLSSKYVTKC